MAYLDQQELEAMGFLTLGKNVLISDKASIYEPGKMSLGDNTRIDDFCVVSGNIKTGRNVHIAALCLVAGGEKGIKFGDYSGLAYGVKIFSQSDDYSGETLTNPTVPDDYKNELKAHVSLGRHVIVGTNSVIAPGVSLGEGVAVGAGAVVLKSFPEWVILAGAPARVIKARSRNLLKMEDHLREDEEQRTSEANGRAIKP